MRDRAATVRERVTTKQIQPLPSHAMPLRVWPGEIPSCRGHLGRGRTGFQPVLSQAVANPVLRLNIYFAQAAAGGPIHFQGKAETQDKRLFKAREQ